jgi:hypothetical protein
MQLSRMEGEIPQSYRGWNSARLHRSVALVRHHEGAVRFEHRNRDLGRYGAAFMRADDGDFASDDVEALPAVSVNC